MERFLENGKWKCIQCSACCRFMQFSIPEFATEDGSCKYLIENKCSIYDSRPELCKQIRLPNDDKIIAASCATLLDTYENK